MSLLNQVYLLCLSLNLIEPKKESSEKGKIESEHERERVRLIEIDRYNEVSRRESAKSATAI
jgi:hypothetical protein